MNQCERILNYINKFGSINPLEAMSDLGIIRLASRICDLKKDGYNIERTITKAKNRFGECVYFCTYSINDN